MAFDMKEIEKLLKGIGSSGKSNSKSEKEMIKLQGKLQQQLAEQQAEYARQLASQQAAASLEAQREANRFNQPFMEATATGTYNGQQTLASKQFDESTRQFGVESELEKQKLALSKDIQTRQIALDELSQQQDNAIAQGNLDLSRQIETEKVRLQSEQQEATIRLQTAELSGVMENGSLTEAARAARVREGQEGTQLMGVDAQGRLTDASQQWRTSAALDAARTNAQLGQQSSDYFEAAAYNRDPNVQNALAFLNASQQGSSMGFRSAATGVPGTNSIQNLQGGQPINPALIQGANNGPVPNPQQNVAGIEGAPDGPSPSLAAAQAAAQGQDAAFTSSMHKVVNDPADATMKAQYGPDAAFTAAQAGLPPQQPQVAGSVALYNQNVSMRPDAAQQRLSQIQNQIIKPGAHRLAPGTMESWSPTEKGLVTSGLRASGVNPADFEQSYNRAKLQTNLSATAI